MRTRHCATTDELHIKTTDIGWPRCLCVLSFLAAGLLSLTPEGLGGTMLDDHPVDLVSGLDIAKECLYDRRRRADCAGGSAGLLNDKQCSRCSRLGHLPDSFKHLQRLQGCSIGCTMWNCALHDHAPQRR